MERGRAPLHAKASKKETAEPQGPAVFRFPPVNALPQQQRPPFFPLYRASWRSRKNVL